MGAPKEDLEKYDIAVISDESDVLARTQSICAEFGFSSLVWKSLDEFLENSKAIYKLVVASLKDYNKSESAAELAQAIRYCTHDHAFVVCCIPKSVNKDAAVFAKKSGASLILIRDEVMTTSKVEFAALQSINSSFIPVKASDLKPNLTIDFDLYHLLAQRGKFLRFLAKGDVISENRFSKLGCVGEIYIHRTQAPEFKNYINSQNDRTAAGLARRCRAQFLALHANFLNLILLLTDQSENASFAEGQKLLKACQNMCDELLGLLGERGDAWEVINNSAIGELGSVERGPALAAYAGLLGLQMGLDNLNELMLAALLSDLGLILVSPNVAKYLRSDGQEKLSSEEAQEFRNYPSFSLELALNRKLALDEKFRQTILCTQERADGKGFPKGILADKIPVGAQLIQFCRDLDRRTMLKLGKARPNRERVLREMFEEDVSKCERYSKEFWDLMRKAQNW